MAHPSSPSLRSDDEATPGTFWRFLGAPMAGNASFLAGFLYWLAVAFKWFLRLLLVLLAVGVVLGIGALIFGSLPLHNIWRGGKSRTSRDQDGPVDTEVVGLDFLATEHDLEQDLASDSADDRALPPPTSVHGDSYSIKGDKSPPRYTSAPDAVATDNKTSTTSPAFQRCLRICPHETMSFERLQRIAKLPNFHRPEKKIDGLTCKFQQHMRGHLDREEGDSTNCQPIRNRQDQGPLTRVSGLGTPQKCDSVETLRSYLAPANIWLCKHKQIVDRDILDLIYEILNPCGKLADPINRYVAEETGIECDRCDTNIHVVKGIGHSSVESRCQIMSQSSREVKDQVSDEGPGLAETMMVT
ncbi:MAG: hypothetical protein ASARMPREDX12_004155 [Alectoria sarmentosa]|nr:MAG: hypothetical protein ASARMPREDX12_004155 [Alectoria sarmentosa]